MTPAQAASETSGGARFGRRAFSRVRTLVALAAATSWALIGATAANASPSVGQAPASHYDHIFVIVEESHSFTDVIGNPATPNLISELDHAPAAGDTVWAAGLFETDAGRSPLVELHLSK